MFAGLKHVVLAGVIALSAPLSHATDMWTGNKTILAIEVVETGGFLVTFTTPLTTPCPNAGAATIYFYPNQNFLTADGVKAHYATALMAFASGKQFQAMYDSSSTYCFARYSYIQ